MQQTSADIPNTLSKSDLKVQSEVARLPAIQDDRAKAAAEIVRLSHFLEASERGIVKAIYEDGQSLKHLAAMLGVERRSMSRRIRSLVRRIRSPEFAFVALHAKFCDVETRRIAVACVLHGRSARSAASEIGMTYSAARARRRAVMQMARGAKLMNQATNGGGVRCRGNAQSGSSARWRRSA